jgi:hypothetical protein
MNSSTSSSSIDSAVQRGLNSLNIVLPAIIGEKVAASYKGLSPMERFKAESIGRG